MSARNKSASETTIVTRECVIGTMARLVRNEIEVTRRFTLDQIATESGVEKRVIQTWLSRQPEEQREPKLSDALSVAVVLGKRAVNGLFGVVGYTGHPLDEVDPEGPAMAAAEAMAGLAVFARAAADNRIDHTEEPEAERAVDNVIDLLTPFSGRGKAA